MASIPKKAPYDSCCSYPPESYVRYLNNATVQAAIGAFVNYTEQSAAVAAAFNTTGDDGRLEDSTTDMQILVDRGIAVNIFTNNQSGLTDRKTRSRWCTEMQTTIVQSSFLLLFILTSARSNSEPGNWLGGEAVWDSILPFGSFHPGYINISTSDLIVHGQAKQTGRFSFARIYDSGHEVPYYQPLTALAIFERIIHGYDIATGVAQVGVYHFTSGPLSSTYREGNSTVKFALETNGGESRLKAMTSEHFTESDSEASRMSLPELHATGKKPKIVNATDYGNVVQGLKETAKEKERIHLRKRLRMLRRKAFV